MSLKFLGRRKLALFLSISRIILENDGQTSEGGIKFHAIGIIINMIKQRLEIYLL